MAIFPFAAQAGEAVTYVVDGETFEGYRATANGDSKGLVLIIHDWDGLTEYEMKRADMLADMGYDAFAVDLFGEGNRPKAAHSVESWEKTSKIDDAESGGVRDGVGAADRIEFVEQRANVKLGGVDGDAKPPGAIILFDAPSASSVRTSSSRGVSGTSPSAVDDGSVGSTTAASAVSFSPKPQARYTREQRGEPVGEHNVREVERQPDRVWGGVLTHLSAMVSGTCFVSPARRNPSVTVWPTLSGPSARRSKCTCRIGSLFHVTMMSPW